MKYDFLIIGQGIAGSVLAYTLLKRGAKVLVADEGLPGTSSKVAAGIFNPITGRKMVKTWMADQLYPKLHRFYPDLEAATDSHFFYPMPIYFPFDSQEKQNYWQAESALPDYQGYIERFEGPGFAQGTIHDPFGGMLARQSGYVDIPAMLDAVKGYLLRHNAYWQGHISRQGLSISDGSVEVQGFEAEKVVFCDGPSAASHLWWGWLPFRPVKGELLHVTFEGEAFPAIINRGCWILPHHSGLHRVGATYDNRDLSLQATATAREQLLTRLRALTDAPFIVESQHVGIRPATYDRRPFLGVHPQHPEVGLFNGLGTKGISLAPYFAEIMAVFLEKDAAIPPSVDIRRVPDKFKV